jgi:hypothetical protein
MFSSKFQFFFFAKTELLFEKQVNDYPSCHFEIFLKNKKGFFVRLLMQEQSELLLEC